MTPSSTARAGRHAPVLAVLAALAATALLGCGSDDDSADDDTGTTAADDAAGGAASDGDDGGDGGSAAAAGDLPRPCEVVDAGTFAGAVGIDLGSGEVRSGSITEQDRQWQTDECRWTGADIEVEVRISGADDFPDGAVGCIEPVPFGDDAAVEPVEGLGDQAWWAVEDDGETELRVCAPAAMVAVVVEPEEALALEVGTVRGASIELAQQALGALPA